MELKTLCKMMIKEAWHLILDNGSVYNAAPIEKQQCQQLKIFYCFTIDSNNELWPQTSPL